MPTATASKSSKRSSSRFKSYDDLVKHTNRPLSQRPSLSIGRGGNKIVPRRVHLTDDEVTALTETYKESGKDLLSINPHNKGFYFYLFAALAAHPNEEVPQSRVMKALETLMSDESTIEGEGKDATTAWERWVNKGPRNAETGKDWEGRFEQNVLVLQRLTGLTPYGRRIHDLHKVIGGKGVVIDVIVKDTGTKYLRLNTNAERPINEAKVRGMGSPAFIKAEKAEKRAAKKGKAKRKAKAPVEAKTEPSVEDAPVAETATA